MRMVLAEHTHLSLIRCGEASVFCEYHPHVLLCFPTRHLAPRLCVGVPQEDYLFFDIQLTSLRALPYVGRVYAYYIGVCYVARFASPNLHVGSSPFFSSQTHLSNSYSPFETFY